MSGAECLRLVKSWHDPFPAPILECHEGVMVVRDDLLNVGTKVRYLDALLSCERDVDEWVYGSCPRVGFGQVSLAYVARQHEKKSTIFIAKADKLHENSLKAKKYGARIVQVPMGFLAVTEARAREYTSSWPTRRLLPIGLGHEVIFGAIVKVARALDFKPQEVWTVAGGGVLNRGLQMAWPDAECFAVSVGHQLTAEETGRAVIHRHYLKLAQPCRKEFLPPFPSNRSYDAKAWEFIKRYANTRKRVLFWNVAG